MGRHLLPTKTEKVEHTHKHAHRDTHIYVTTIVTMCVNIHSELVLPACAVDSIPAGHTRMTLKTEQSHHTLVNRLSAQSDTYHYNTIVKAQAVTGHIYHAVT